MNTEIPVAPGTELQAGNLSQEWLDKLAQYAKETQLSERTASNFFSTQSGVLAFNGMAIPNNTMECIALVSMHENVWYEGTYDASNPGSPGCYAYSFTGDAMTPHPEADDIQAPTCGTCPKLKWGSHPSGRGGKACRETRRISLLPAPAAASADMVASATAGLLRVPVTSVKNWAAFVSRLATQNLPPFATTVEIKLSPDTKTMVRMDFTPKQRITDMNVLEALMRRIAVEKNNMIAPYPKRDANAAAAVNTSQSAFAAPKF